MAAADVDAFPWMSFFLSLVCSDRNLFSHGLDCKKIRGLKFFEDFFGPLFIHIAVVLTGFIRTAAEAKMSKILAGFF